LLENINSPKDLKALDMSQLSTVASEIRELMLKVVSKRGGHLASSLGAVELCVSLHYLLNAPDDSIIFDVGHQTYAHKILTGRRDSFCKLREFQGICGFPDPKESKFDPYLTGHASTAVSYAQGISEANKLMGNTFKSVAIVGDGSLSGGMCFEALNNCGHAQSDILVIYNHNEMSISPSVGALSNYLTKLVSAPAYNRIKNELEDFLANFSLIKKISSKARRFEEALKGLLIPGIFFEELGFRYFGPIDGNDLDILIPTLKNILSLKGPKLLHVETVKGKGFGPAEQNPEEFHSASPFDLQTGRSVKNNSLSYGEVFATHLIQMAEKDKRIVAITAAMPKGTGLNLFQEKFPERLFDVGIAEAHAVGFASGLAKAGLIPFVAIYSTFLQRAYDQMIHDVALQNLKVIFILDRAGVVGEDGPTHHGVFDIAYLRSLPNMVCMAPKDGEELKEMLQFSLSLNSPVSIRYPKGAVYSHLENSSIELGKFEMLKQGRDICLIALGAMVKEAVKACDILMAKGVYVTLINARFIKPLDSTLLKELSSSYKHIFTLEDGNLPGGFGSSVLEFLEEEKLITQTEVHCMGFPDKFVSFAKREKLLELYKLDAVSISEEILTKIDGEII